jgi:hypothetical protein
VHRSVVALTLLVLAAAPARAQEPITGEDAVAVRALLSADALEVLRRAERFTLLALIPERRPDRDDDRLREYPVRAHEQLDLAVRRPVLAALYRDLSSGGAPCRCVGPHHAIVATRGGERVELLLCYSCAWVQVKDEAGTRGTALGRSSERALNARLGQTEAAPLIRGRTYDDWVERLDGEGAAEARAAIAETLVYLSGRRQDDEGHASVHERWSKAQVTLELHNAPVHDAFDALREAARLPLELTAEARDLLESEAVTATIEGGEAPAKEALERLLAAHPDLDLRVRGGRLVVGRTRPDERLEVEAREGDVELRRRTVALLTARAKALRAEPAKALARAALCEEDRRLREEAVAALAALRHEEGVTAALQALVDALTDVHTTPPGVRLAAARLLAELPAAATFAGADLANAAENDPDEWVRSAARDAADRLDR